MQEYEVLYSWHSENNEDLPLKAGTNIVVLDKKDHGWWIGMSTTVPPRKGYFPKSYVRPKNVNEQSEEEKSAEVRFSDALGFNQDIHRRQFSMNTIEAFDDLVNNGVAIEFRFNAPSGTAVSEGSRVTIQCSAMIWDGATTEAHVFSEGILSFTVGRNQVTAGLEEACLKLKVEDEADIICAPIMAYGDAGQPPIVPPDAHIVYSTKVLSVSTATEDLTKGPQGDSLLFFTGISPRVVHSSNSSAITRKAGAVVLVEGDRTKNKDGTEITDEMLAQAASNINLTAKK